MKFQPDVLAGTNVVTRLDGAKLWVGAVEHGGSLVVPWVGAVTPWSPTSFDAVTADDFAALLAFEPELVLVGTGARQRFAAPAMLKALHARRIGVETMDTAAACRTFNVLVAEGRRALAALLPSTA